MSNLFNFVSNNVKGFGSKSKRQNIFQRLKDLIKNKGIIFIQESHSSKKLEETWRDDFEKKIKSTFVMAHLIQKESLLVFVGI